MQTATYRKFNDRSLNSSTYHKKDGTAVRAKLKQELQQEIEDALTPGEDTEEYWVGDTDYDFPGVTDWELMGCDYEDDLEPQNDYESYYSCDWD